MSIYVIIESSQGTTPTGTIYSIYSDMLKECHLLIAGAAGSGKSVVLNALIYTALYKAPSEAAFVLCDPKMVELSRYTKLPPVIRYADTLDGIASALPAFCDAGDMADILLAVNDALWWAETEYALTVGDESAPGCYSCYQGAQRATLVRNVERLRDAVGTENTHPYLDMDDEEALPILQKIADRKGGTQHDNQ